MSYLNTLMNKDKDHTRIKHSIFKIIITITDCINLKKADDQWLSEVDNVTTQIYLEM